MSGRTKRTRADGHNRGIRDLNGDLWEVELGRTGQAANGAGTEQQQKVVFCRKPDGFAFTVQIPLHQTLADYDDSQLSAMIEERIAG